MTPPDELLDALHVRVRRFLGGRANQHWLVTAAGEPLVLRRYQAEPIGEIGYELTVLHRLADLGWPTPVAVAGPVEFAGRTWCLFRWLPGASPTDTGERGQRYRGELLARLHHDLATLVDLGQRPGALRSEQVLADPDLSEQLRAYARLFPREARVLRWHLERARTAFDDVEPRECRLIVVHGDFINQNLLQRDGVLTGVIDFESTHLNHVVADFALAWRGKYDHVIDAYAAINPLTEVDRALLAPALWAWTFLGVATEIRRMVDGTITPHGFEWQTRRLLRRSPLMGPHSAPYRE